MTNKGAISLEDLGWDAFFAAQSPGAEIYEKPLELSAPEAELLPGDFFAARVSRHDGQEYDVLGAGADGARLYRARLGGVLRYRTDSPQELPAVGDWVVVQAEEGRLQTIMAVFQRRTCFVRQAAGQVVDQQVIATNIDTVFVVTAMNLEFEPRRLERYLMAVRAAGAEPVLVLNKQDLTDQPEDFLQQARAVADGAAVLGMSARAPGADAGLDAFSAWLGAGKTVVFVGSSGVGKSTIVNRLIGTEIQETRAARQADDRGRHTTTTRQLLLIPGPPGAPPAGVLIDTPGMREFQLWARDHAEESFDDIEQLNTECYFRDCTHQNEPGCAVRAALEDGSLSPERLDNWLKLQQELTAQRQRQQVAARRVARTRRLKKP